MEQQKAPRRQLRRLTQHEYFKLCNWLNDVVPNLPKGTTYVNVAALASQELQFQVADSSVIEAMKNLNLKIQQKEIDKEKAIKVLAKHLEHLYQDRYPALEIPSDLKELL